MVHPGKPGSCYAVGVPRDVSADVTDAYQRLIAAGYDSRLMNK
jgi:hypothetical protein